MSEQVGGCEWVAQGVKMQYTRCWSCQLGQCPGGPHTWADANDIQHWAETQGKDVSDSPCGCSCVSGPPLLPGEPDLSESLDAGPCPVCGEPGACGYDSEGRPMIHTFASEED